MTFLFSFFCETQEKASMAALIAHITRSDRERLEKKKFEIIITKCMYEIRPFEKCYDPMIHNKYVLFKALRCELDDATSFYKVVIDRLNILDQERTKKRSFKIK